MSDRKCSTQVVPVFRLEKALMKCCACNSTTFETQYEEQFRNTFVGVVPMYYFTVTCSWCKKKARYRMVD